jgi:transcriptional regulator GlxA family with amidase domain
MTTLSSESFSPQPLPRRIIFLLLPHINLLDLGGPAQVFASAAALGAAYTLEFWALTPTILSAQGLSFGPLAPLGIVAATDLIIIPGVSLETYPLYDQPLPPAVGRWLQESAVAGARLAAVCTGAFALGEAGLLNGRRCTTHWAATTALQQRYPTAQVLEGVLYVHDSAITTSAGIAAGIDMALSLVERDYGPLFVAQLARNLVVYLRRDGMQPQQSVYLDYRTHLHPGVHRAQDFIIAHLTETLTGAQIAAAAAMRLRTLIRAFRAATGLTLVQYQQRLRIEFAARLLTTSSLSIEAIAQRTGFADARHFRRVWSRHVGTPPSAFTEKREHV